MDSITIDIGDAEKIVKFLSKSNNLDDDDLNRIFEDMRGKVALYKALFGDEEE